MNCLVVSNFMANLAFGCRSQPSSAVVIESNVKEKLIKVEWLQKIQKLHKSQRTKNYITSTFLAGLFEFWWEPQKSIPINDLGIPDLSWHEITENMGCNNSTLIQPLVNTKLYKED